MKSLKLIKFWTILGLIYVVAIFYLCLKRSEPSIPPFEHFDKILHFSAYFTLTSYFTQITKLKNLRALILIFFIMGVTIEVLQYFSGYRSFEMLDILANTLGVLAGAFIVGRYCSGIIFKLEKVLNFKDA
ncbi:hypothetical protein BIY24_14635 [Halobacteriovorax marinus]|uniref:VanZ family protein n=1 Tax=Halobacteriovorax marinus TaxID=97084 RepID=UPI000BC326F1|nr:VanZ family protein [Halobacteriovorax marinus]ATH09134.1 hypothetical protein BIY24_14635 [Halobacteriovorax marinus]